jgi:hypothetical protein
VPLPTAPNPEAAAQGYVALWFDLLSQHQWPEALAMLDLPSSYGVVWSEVVVRGALSEYSRGEAYSVTSPAAIATKPNISTGVFNDGSGFWLDCEFPLNGEWTDLTAQFEFKVHGNQYLVVLQDIHVL